MVFAHHGTSPLFRAVVAQDYEHWWAYIESRPLLPCGDNGTSTHNFEQYTDYANNDYYDDTDTYDDNY